MCKKIIWQNYDLNPEDWRDFLEEEYPEVTDEYEQYRLIAEMNDEYLDDERINLDIPVENGILLLGSIGLWDGRRQGYKEIQGPCKISDCLEFGNSCDYAEWYVEKDELCSRQSHHDGTNYITYRKWKDGVDDDKKDRVKDAIYSGKLTKALLGRYTQPLGPEVGKVYGW